MQQERAEDRDFRRILDDGELLAMRPKILAALWTLVREWDVAGRPKASRFTQQASHAGLTRLEP